MLSITKKEEVYLDNVRDLMARSLMKVSMKRMEVELDQSFLGALALKKN